MTSQRHICPCCGHFVQGASGQYTICPRCRWEDDPVQANDPHFAGGANKCSLEEARRAWISRRPRVVVKRRRYGRGRK